MSEQDHPEALLSDAADGFLRSHVYGVLATNRRDGAPQQSMIAYAVLADDTIAISTKSYTAKWKNAVRDQRVSVAISPRSCSRGARPISMRPDGVFKPLAVRRNVNGPGTRTRSRL